MTTASSNVRSTQPSLRDMLKTDLSNYCSCIIAKHGDAMEPHLQGTLSGALEAIGNSPDAQFAICTFRQAISTMTADCMRMLVIWGDEAKAKA